MEIDTLKKRVVSRVDELRVMIQDERNERRRERLIELLSTNIDLLDYIDRLEGKEFYVQ